MSTASVPKEMTLMQEIKSLKMELREKMRNNSSEVSKASTQSNSTKQHSNTRQHNNTQHHSNSKESSNTKQHINKQQQNIEKPQHGNTKQLSISEDDNNDELTDVEDEMDGERMDEDIDEEEIGDGIKIDNEKRDEGKNEGNKKDGGEGRLQIINVEANEDSAISRFWSIEPGSRQGIRIRLFRNGDKYFGGMEYAVCHTKCRSMEYLYDQLNRSLVNDPISMPYGVRKLFNLQGHKIKNVADLKDGGIYVVSSATSYVKIDYLSLTGMQEWRGGIVRKKPLGAVLNDHNRLELKRLDVVKVATSEERLAVEKKKNVIGEIKKNIMIYVLRNDAIRPRKVLKWLLGPKTGATFEKVMSVLSEKLAVPCGPLEKLHSSDGTELLSLEDMYNKANQVFFGFGQEQVRRSDFILEKEEIRVISEISKKGSSADKVLIIPFVQNDPDKPVLPEQYKLNDEVMCTNEDKVCLKMCKDSKHNANYVLKIFNMSKLSKPQQLKVRREMRIMRMLKHTNVMHADLISCDDNFSCLFFKKFPKCSLAEILLNDNHYHCERFVSDVVMQVSKGLGYLASYQVVNRNVTLESIVADITFSGLVQFKLCDFGLARKIKSLDRKLYLICGNPNYIAPEMLLGGGYDTRVDVWSLGILMYVLLTGRYPFQVKDQSDCNEIFSQVADAPIDVKSTGVWDLVSSEAKELLKMMINRNPNQRINPHKMQAYPWIAQASTFAPEKDLRSVVKDKLYTHIVESELMSLDCLEVLCVSSIDKEPFYFVNAAQDVDDDVNEENIDVDVAA